MIPRRWCAGGTVYAAAIAAIVLSLAGCGGSSGPRASGDTVAVSLAAIVPNAAPSAAGNLPAPLASAPSPESFAADNVVNVWVTIERIALIPAGDAEGPAGHVAADITPAEVDLLALRSGQAGLSLAAIDNVPAGTYGKIRLYYSGPKVYFDGAPDNTGMHPTAHAHLDVHFVGGDLDIPVATGEGVRIHDVTIVFVLGKDGLKITANTSAVLMRPQVFATFEALQYLVAGVADNVDKTAGVFDIATGDGRSFRAAYDIETAWSFSEGDPDGRTADVDAALGAAALDDTALVAVIGPFSDSGLLLAADVTITFPSVLAGTVASGTETDGWNADDTFTLDLAADNVVTPGPSRSGARYDNAADLAELPAHDNAVVKGVFVTARGYGAPDGVEAFWISFGLLP